MFACLCETLTIFRPRTASLIANWTSNKILSIFEPCISLGCSQFLVLINLNGLYPSDLPHTKPGLSVSSTNYLILVSQIEPPVIWRAPASRLRNIDGMRERPISVEPQTMIEDLGSRCVKMHFNNKMVYGAIHQQDRGCTQHFVAQTSQKIYKLTTS